MIVSKLKILHSRNHVSQEHDSWGNSTSLEGGNVRRKKINKRMFIKRGFKIGQKNKRKDTY